MSCRQTGSSVDIEVTSQARCKHPIVVANDLNFHAITFVCSRKPLQLGYTALNTPAVDREDNERAGTHPNVRPRQDPDRDPRAEWTGGTRP
jgi:hypothetical protein